MRRLALALLLLGCASPVFAQQDCITINGIQTCSSTLRLFDSSTRIILQPVLDLSQTWNNPATTFTGLRLNITDTNSNAASLLADFQVGGVSKFQFTKSAAIGVTSTDGFTIQNPALSTASTTVQMSPRAKWCGTAYNSTSAASETDCFFAETLPATVAGTTTASWKIGVTINGTAATYPVIVSSAGALTASSTVNSGGGLYPHTSGRAFVDSLNDGWVKFENSAASVGVEFKVDALPTVSSGFGTSPSITAGSSAFAGSVNVGTGGAATSGIINFNGTAFPSAPFCVANDATTTLAQRATATTTQLTITSAAWTASDIVTWICVSSR